MKEELIYKIFASNIQANLSLDAIQDYGVVRMRLDKNGQTIPYTINELGIERPVILDDSFEASIFAIIGQIQEQKNENNGFGSNYLIQQEIPFEIYFFMPNFKSKYNAQGVETALKTILQAGIGGVNIKTLKMQSFVLTQLNSDIDKHEIFNNLYEGAKNQLKTESIFVKLTFAVEITFMSNCRNECADVALQTLVLNCEKPEPVVIPSGGGGPFNVDGGNASSIGVVPLTINGGNA